MKELISHEELLRVLHYDPKTGVFKWKVSVNNNSARKGDMAGTLNHGYIQIQVQGALYRASRLAWFYHYGVWPIGLLDHIDTIRHHNWISNLREATKSENGLNCTKYSNNKSGYKGVTFSKKGWAAQCTFKGEHYNLGRFPTPELASEAYQKFAKENHGEFHYNG